MRNCSSPKSLSLWMNRRSALILSHGNYILTSVKKPNEMGSTIIYTSSLYEEEEEVLQRLRLLITANKLLKEQKSKMESYYHRYKRYLD